MGGWTQKWTPNADGNYAWVNRGASDGELVDGAALPGEEVESALAQLGAIRDQRRDALRKRALANLTYNERKSVWKNKYLDDFFNRGLDDWSSSPVFWTLDGSDQ